MVVSGRKTIIEDEIVISGMSGRFPECDTVEEFQDKLLSGIHLVRENDSRWPKGYLDTYSQMGFMKDLRNFDAPFFGAHPKLAERTDPIVRTLLETSFEAVLDAGICPTTLRGTETGVVVVVSSNEAADWWSADPDRVNGYEFLGCTRTMYSNRISFAMDLRGPSYTMDSQSSSGLLGIQQAYHMLKCGMVDAVIVAGVNLVLNPHFNIMFKKLNMLSPDGKCKVFDADADGYARSEAGVAVVLQRAKDAHRVYAYVAGVDANCDGFKEEGCNAVSMSSQIDLYRDTYQNFNLNPLDVSFVEAHGYSTLDGDKDELNGITEVFCKGREEPLLIGSVKSNMGHGEPVGGLVSLVKILLAMENGILPPNLHFKTPNPNVPALKDGRLHVVDKLTVWNGKYAAINSFGIGGTNSHVVLRRNEKEKVLDKKIDLPRLVAVSGRTEEAVQSLLNSIENLQGDNEFFALINNIFREHIQHYNYRAFSVFGDERITEVETYIAQEAHRPICFVFSGMGSQWPGMCKDLLDFEIFRKTIDECSRILKTVDFDLYGMLKSNDKKIYSDVLNSFIGITCTQIALVNILRELDIKPDFIIGHSIGELGCAYADETLTLEQTVMTTYWRGKSLLMTKIPSGAMAAIGLSYHDISHRLPSDITVACHNSIDNVTISGPPESIKNFTKQLQSEGIFAREVNSSGYAFHSQYIADVGPIFKTQLEKIITNPKPRSKRWISTSVPDSMWNTPLAQYSSVVYHLNNLLSPVYFNKALTYVPDNAVVIEIAPHALLQSILKGSLSSKCAHVGLLRRNQSTINDLLANIGRLYNAGLQPQLSKLYPPVSFPVSRKTPMIQSMIQWDHSTKWFLVSFLTKPACVRGEIEVDVDVTNERYKFLLGCIVDDTPTFPIAGYLSLIWEAVAKFQYNFISEIPLVIENFQLIRKCTLSKQNPLKFVVNILEHSGECEIREDGVVVARAIVKLVPNIDEEFSDLTPSSSQCDNYLPLKPNDFYQDLFMKGYSYKKEFKQVLYVDNKGENGKIAWSDNWTTYLESMLQLHLLSINKQQHYSINHIQKVIIDPKKHIKGIEESAAKSGVPVQVFSDVNIIKSGAIEIRGVKSTLVSVRKKQREPAVVYSTFIPHISNKIFTSSQAITVCAELVFENSDTHQSIKIAEIISDSNSLMSCKISEIAKLEPYVTPEITIFAKDNIQQKLPSIDNAIVKSENDFIPSTSSQKYNFIISSNCYHKTNVLNSLLESLVNDGFLLTVEDAQNAPSEEDINALECKLITKLHTEKGAYLLIRRKTSWKTPMVIVLRNDSFNWIDAVKMALRKHKIDKRNTMLIFHGNDPTGVIGFMKSLRQEQFGTGLRCLYTDDSINPYKIVDLTYIDYLRKGLAFNIYKNGEWGSYRHFPIENPAVVECEHAFIGVREVGDFSSLAYIEGRLPYIDNMDFSGRDLCHVYYVAVYPHRDVFKALGLLSLDDGSDICNQGSVLGHEYSGRDSKGRRVFGMVGGGALATTVLADKTVMWEVPDHWSLEQASTIPRIYSVAYYALLIRANLQKGETVYINAGIMGLCVACLNVALGVGAEVFIGFNNQAEKKYLKQIFPKLPEKSFINLEESSFEYQLLEHTNGKGVDVIFDTLNSHKRNLFVDALAVNGRLLEFEKSTIFNETLGYAAIEKNITFHKISHNTLWVSEAGLQDRKKIYELVRDGVRSGIVKPIVTNIFTEDQIVEAFRVAQSGKFVGKIVIKIRDEEPQRSVIPKTKLVRAYPSAFLNPQHSYIVTGGLTDFGIQVVDWLITRGANKIILQSQYRPVTGYQCLALRRWKSNNVNVVLSNVDATNVIGAEILIIKANVIAPVGGIFHAAHVKCNCLLEKCTQGHFDLLWKLKVEMAKNLDEVSKKLCPALQYFVGFSETASLHGISGKSMFGYVNSAMEMIYVKRRANDYPATIIQKGPIEKVENEESNQNYNGLVPMKSSSLMKKIPDLLNQPYAVMSVYNVDKSSEINVNNVTCHKAIDDIADLLEIKNPWNVHTLTFEDIGMEPVVSSEIQKVLKNYGINVTEKEIRQLSFAKIISILNKE